MNKDELHKLLKTQRGLAVDPDGELLYVCEAPAIPQNADTTTYESAQNNTSASGDPFRLHSLPGTTRIIYLDFNGHTTTGTQWNSSSGISSIVSQPFDLDGSPTTWSATEQDVIRRVWQRVAEDYAPFAVDVTTEDPGVEALRRTSSSDTAYGIRVVISPTNWYNTGAGGVGYLNSFSASSDTPCFAFTAQLANSEGPIGETAAHEAGHTLGLYHDGSTAGEYYAGQGDWAPIMGNSFYRPVTQFSRGEYAGANNTQDDLAVISGFVPFATDDHGNTFDTASTLAGPNVSDGGTIERSTDVDVFRFTTSGGSVSLNIQGPSPSPDLDIQAELLSASGQSLQVSNPAGLSATINTTVASGTYYVRIRGVGAGDPVSTGYSNYASVGNYVITGTIASGSTTPPPPDTGGGGTAQPFVTSVSPGSSRNDYTGWVGMQITVGGSPLSVTELGRMSVSGNSRTHTVKLVNATDGQDVVGGSVVVSMSGSTAGEFRYSTLAIPVTLSAGMTYYLVSEEVAGQDAWHDWSTTVTTIAGATNTAAAYGRGPGDWHSYGGANRSYVPVNMKFTVGTSTSGGGTGSGQTFVTAVAPGTARNNYTGWVGMQITIGASPIEVTDLGRMMVSGNVGTHRMKIVNAADGQDVAGATVSVSMSGGAMAEFRYATLSTPVTLQGGATYFILSEEVSGGDNWYDLNTIVTTTNAAVNSAAAYGSAAGDWHALGGASRSYVPVNFKYRAAAGSTGGTSTGSNFVTNATPGTVRNNFSGWVGMQITIGSAPVTVSHLGRMIVAGNSGSHRLKLVKASDGQDVSGATVTVSTSGGTAGQFRYTALPTPVVLAAGATYYLLSEEAFGGDSWHDFNSSITTTTVARAESAAYGTGPGDWHAYGAANQSYVPVSFIY